MELTAEQKAELQTLIDEEVSKKVAELKAPIRKIPLAPEGEPQIKFMADETDKLLKAPLGGFKSAGHFYTDIVRADSPGGRISETLGKWNDVVTKTTGHMEEGDLAQGGY